MPTDRMRYRRSTDGMVDYNGNSSVQQSRIASHDQTIRRLVRDIGSARPEFRIADYGCGPGTSTVNVARPAIEAYLEIDDSGPIAVCHADLPGNDWNSLFARVSGAEGYLQYSSKIRLEAAVGSFYDRLLPDRSVNLATCFAASHWLSQTLSIDAPGAVLFADLRDEARLEMAAIARNDWIRFLKLRSQELRPGGYLLVSTLGSVPDPCEQYGLAASGRALYRAIQIVAQSMVDDGLLEQKVLDRFVFGLWFPTEEEALHPIQSDPTLSRHYDIQEVSVNPPLNNENDVFGALINDPVDYARHYKDYVYAFTRSTLYAQLFRPVGKSESDADILAREFYLRFEALYQKYPGTYKFELYVLTVILRKRDQ